MALRLRALTHGQTRANRARLFGLRLITFFNLPDILPMLFYAKDRFGEPFSVALHRALRGPSAWSIADRELMAAWVSRNNDCPFCEESHGRVADGHHGERSYEQIFADIERAPIDARLRAALQFAETLTRRPGEVTRGSLTELRAQGLSKQDIADVAYVTGLFCVINRIANALGFDANRGLGSGVVVTILRRFGYKDLTKL